MILMGALMGADRYGSQYRVTVLEDVLQMWSPTMPSCTIWPMAMSAMAAMATMADCRRGLVRCIWWSSSSVEVTRPSDFTRYKLFNSGINCINWYCSSGRKVLVVFFGVSCCISFLHAAHCGMGLAWGLQPTTVTFNSAMTSSAWEAMDHRLTGLMIILMSLKSLVDLNGFYMMDVNGRKWIWMGCGFLERYLPHMKTLTFLVRKNTRQRDPSALNISKLYLR